MPNKNEEYSNDLSEKLINKVYGINGNLKDLLNIDDDVNINLGNGVNQSNSNGNIADLAIRSGKRKEFLKETFDEMMTRMGQSYVNTLPQNDRIRLNKEYNFMLTQMPQLYSTLSMMAQFIMSPDNYANDPLEYDISIGDSSKDVTESDVLEALADKNLYKLVKEGIRDSLCLGYRYYEICPLIDIAQRLLKRIEHKNKKVNFVQQDKGANNIIQYTQSFSHKNSKINDDDVVFYGEGTDCVVIPSEFVHAYREAYDHGGAEAENYKKMIYDAIDDTITSQDDSCIKKYAESYAKTESHEDYQKLLASTLFSPTYTLSRAEKDNIARKVHARIYGEADDENYIQALKSLKNARRSKKRTKIRDLTGCHVELLDDERVHPIIVNKEEIGVYYIETYEDAFMSKAQMMNINNVLGSSKFSDQADYRDNPLIRQDIINGLSALITEHMDANFVTDNRRILASIESLLREKDLYNLQFRVRWIPRRHLVPFHTPDAHNGIGKSRLMNARIPIIFWIYLNQDKLLTKLFYEKDKLAIKYRTTFAQSLFNDRADAMEIFTNLFPLPSELLDFTRINSSMGTIGRLLIPVDKSGNELFQIDRIEGQKPDTSNDDYMGYLEKVIENLIGFPLSSLFDAENKYDYATSIIAQDGRLTTLIRDMQLHYTPSATELATKIARYETGSDDVVVDVKFPAPKVLTKSISNDNMSKFMENIENNIKMYYGEDGLSPTKRIFIQRELIKALYGSYDNSELFERIEKKWEANKDIVEAEVAANAEE